MTRHLNAILNSYSEIFFLRNRFVGFLLLIITFINPYVALGGLVAVISAYLFSRLINMDRDFLDAGIYTYNPLLTGLAIGYLFQFTPLAVLFMVIAGILTFVTTIMLQSIFSYYLKLPILSLPFVIISVLAYLASTQYSNLFVSGLYARTIYDFQIAVPYWIEGYLKSLGAVFFMPNIISGLAIALIFLSVSRILFLLSLLGYYSGTLVIALMIGSSTQAFADINHFNFILIAIAVGGIYLIPSVKSYLLAIISVCTATILLDAVLVFWANFSIPAFTLPFNIVSLTFVYVLGLIKYPQMAWIIKHTPEETLDLYLSNKRRYKGEYRTIMLPFSGKWTVYQGFNGQWTHKGSWKYAYDFVITDGNNNTFKGDGFNLEDYYCFKKPVLSPVSGRVVKVIKNISDNPVGEVDKVHNWGNLVIIKCESEFYVEISHFAEDSIKVEEGNWVERGSLLGHCGNSGYSPQPHIHVQVQETDTVGGYTIPFSFVNYLTGTKYSANDLPDEDTIVEPLYIENKYESLTSFILDEEYHYEIFNDGKKIDDLNLKVEMEIDGTFYFKSGKGKLYFGKHEGTFYFFSTEGNDPYLMLMFQALPRLPLSYRENLEWNDSIPIGQVTKGFIRGAVQFISSFKHNIFSTEINLKFNSTKEVSGKIFSRMPRVEKESLVELDDSDGFNRIKVDNIELKRIVK